MLLLYFFANFCPHIIAPAVHLATSTPRTMRATMLLIFTAFGNCAIIEYLMAGAAKYALGA